MEHKILFQTPSGSRLYGLAHENSDEDWYTVVEKVPRKKKHYSTHEIVGNVDSVVVDFGTWQDFCMEGVPQALEAMFSKMATVDRIAEFREGFRAGRNYDKYERAIKAFALDNDNSFKHKRHALRLAVNLRDLRRHDRFDPTLDSTHVALVNSLASLSPENVYNDALAIAEQ